VAGIPVETFNHSLRLRQSQTSPFSLPLQKEEESLAVAVPDGAVALGRSDIRLTVVVEIAELENVVTVSTKVAETALPPAVALVEVDVRSSAAAEAAGAEVQVPVPVRVGEVGAEQAPLLTVGHEIVMVPGRPHRSAAVPESDLEQVIAEFGIRAVAETPVVVKAVPDVRQTVVVDIPDRHAAVAETAVLPVAPVAGPVSEPDHDPFLLRVDLGIAVVSDRDDVHMPVAVDVRHLQLGIPLLPGWRAQTGGGLHIAQRANGSLTSIPCARSGLRRPEQRTGHPDNDTPPPVDASLIHPPSPCR
jgi:hypothetical protein